MQIFVLGGSICFYATHLFMNIIYTIAFQSTQNGGAALSPSLAAITYAANRSLSWWNGPF